MQSPTALDGDREDESAKGGEAGEQVGAAIPTGWPGKASCKRRTQPVGPHVRNSWKAGSPEPGDRKEWGWGDPAAGGWRTCKGLEAVL